VSPPKRRYWVNDVRHRSESAEFWREQASAHEGSWWPDWMAWLKPRAGELVDARPADNEQFPQLAPAPGTYVLES